MGNCTEGTKAIAKDASGEGLISRVYEELIQLHPRRTDGPAKEVGKGPDWTLLQRGRADAQGTDERCSRSPATSDAH